MNASAYRLSELERVCLGVGPDMVRKTLSPVRNVGYRFLESF